MGSLLWDAFLRGVGDGAPRQRRQPASCMHGREDSCRRDRRCAIAHDPGLLCSRLLPHEPHSRTAVTLTAGAKAVAASALRTAADSLGGSSRAVLAPPCRARSHRIVAASRARQCCDDIGHWSAASWRAAPPHSPLLSAQRRGAEAQNRAQSSSRNARKRLRLCSLTHPNGPLLSTTKMAEPVKQPPQGDINKDAQPPLGPLSTSSGPEEPQQHEQQGRRGGWRGALDWYCAWALPGLGMFAEAYIIFCEWLSPPISSSGVALTRCSRCAGQ